MTVKTNLQKYRRSVRRAICGKTLSIWRMYGVHVCAKVLITSSFSIRNGIDSCYFGGAIVVAVAVGCSGECMAGSMGWLDYFRTKLKAVLHIHKRIITKPRNKEKQRKSIPLLGF